MVNGVPVNISDILHNITHTIMKENRKVIMNATLISIFVTMLLTIVTISLVFLYSLKYYQAKWQFLLETILLQMQHLNTILQTNHVHLSRCVIAKPKTTIIAE
jgi:flagellar biosynthesis protein FlhB